MTPRESAEFELLCARRARMRGMSAEHLESCLREAARHLSQVIAEVPRYAPEHYPTITWYYETRDEIVGLMQARRVR